jgi:hypothetical protein
MPSDSPRLRRIGHLLFWPPLAVWTWLLVEPNPVPEGVLQLLSWLDIAHYLAAKALHLLGYTYFAVALALWVPRRRRPLFLAFALLLAHGMATEIAQTFVPNRTGRPLDVLIDWAGVSLGVLAGWRWWRPLFGRGVATASQPPPTSAR